MYVRPYFTRHETRIDATATSWRQGISSALGSALTDTMQRLDSYLQNSVRPPVQPPMAIPVVDFEEVHHSESSKKQS